MRSIMKTIIAMGLALGVTACGSFEPVSRNAPISTPEFGQAPRQIERDYMLTGLDMQVSTELRVSESNGYYPFTDIVWRGDPVGNRREQVGMLFHEAARRNMDTLDGNIPVRAQIELVRFHGVTERTRFSVGGVYHIVFQMTLFNAETGLMMEEPRVIEGSLSAPGGAAAILADQRGQTEKVRVTDFLTLLMRDELTGLRAL